MHREGWHPAYQLAMLLWLVEDGIPNLQVSGGRCETRRGCLGWNVDGLPRPGVDEKGRKFKGN